VSDGLPGLLDDYAVEWTIFEPRTPTVTILDHLTGWKRIYGDEYAVIFRRGAPVADR
jgi:hypothetical protein